VQPSLPNFRLSEERVPVPILQAYRKLGDLALVAKARAGDRPALHVLVERHTPRVNRIAAQLIGDFEDARDAAQESLVKLCTKLKQFRGEAQFTTWLHRLTTNTCRDFAERKSLRHTDPLPEWETPAGEESDPSRQSILGDVRRDLLQGLSTLSADQRAVVVLRDVMGFSYDDISRAASMPVGTAKSYVHRGRERLRATLEDGVGTRSAAGTAGLP
jgi:RNA polymerase sigma-70 factor (ECF subfamily)